MIKRIHRATQVNKETRDFNDFTDALMFCGDTANIQTITLHDCWTITVYKVDIDGFKKGMMIEPIKQEVEKTDDRVMSIVEHPYTFVVSSFAGELHALAVAKQLVSKN